MKTCRLTLSSAVETFRGVPSMLCAALVLWTVGQGVCLAGSSAEAGRQISVRGASLAYVDEGEGVPVVFVHGELADLRAWERQRTAVAAHYRFVSYTQRYFGGAQWPDAGEHYTFATHVEDLTRFLRELDTGPAYLVGLSYGGAVAIGVALRHPELVRGVWAHEPSLGISIADQDVRRRLEAEQQGMAGVRRAVESGNADAAVRLYSDWTNRLMGGFHELSYARRQMHMENNRTALVHFSSRSEAPFNCADLGQLSVPMVLGVGEVTRPYFKLLAEAAHRCAPSSRIVVLSRARHDAPAEKPALFNQELMKFLAGSKAAADTGCVVARSRVAMKSD